MKIELVATNLPDVVRVRRTPAGDRRGTFVEQFRADVFRDAGLPDRFDQINQSESHAGVLRGLHFQWDPPQGKLVRVAAGRAFLVSVDIRPGSPTLGKWHAVEMEATAHEQVWAPAGFARGFCALTNHCVVQYLCTSVYSPAAEGGIRWDDPDLGISWPILDPILSDKDAAAPTLAEWLARPEAEAFRWRGGAG